MKVAFFYCCFMLMAFSSMTQGNVDYSKLSQDILYRVKTGGHFDTLLLQLSDAPGKELAEHLKTDNEKKAFWLNIYNAYTQIALNENPAAYKRRNKFFSKKFIRIAGKNISLDGVEHGILRRSKWKFSLGHFNKPFKSKFERQFRVETVDYRIHFALNCGAKSCPPIAFYKTGQIDQQLNLATKVYLKREVKYNMEQQRVEVPAIMSWFRADFGGKKGILKILHEQGLVPVTNFPAIHWKKYDWTISSRAFE
jgi:Protein of unknown function, DUF547